MNVPVSADPPDPSEDDLRASDRLDAGSAEPSDDAPATGDAEADPIPDDYEPL